jgi:hypothetical protein
MTSQQEKSITYQKAKKLNFLPRKGEKWNSVKYQARAVYFISDYTYTNYVDLYLRNQYQNPNEAMKIIKKLVYDDDINTAEYVLFKGMEDLPGIIMSFIDNQKFEEYEYIRYNFDLDYLYSKKVEDEENFKDMFNDYINFFCKDDNVKDKFLNINKKYYQDSNPSNIKPAKMIKI